MQVSLSQKILSEFIGTYLLLLTVVGSGIMGETLSDNNAVTLLGNAIATGAILYVLISMFINISGAYFNPAVVLADLIQQNISIKLAIIFSIVQVSAGILGCMTANWYFEYPIYEWSNNDRSGIYKFISEIVAAFGLVLTILILKKVDKEKIAIGVALFITAGYWFTSSTSFANPAVTISRMFTDTFSGIHPKSVMGFLIAQFIGVIIATYLSRFLVNKT